MAEARPGHCCSQDHGLVGLETMVSQLGGLSPPREATLWICQEHRPGQG